MMPREIQCSVYRGKSEGSTEKARPEVKLKDGVRAVVRVCARGDGTAVDLGIDEEGRGHCDDTDDFVS